MNNDYLIKNLERVQKKDTPTKKAAPIIKPTKKLTAQEIIDSKVTKLKSEQDMIKKHMTVEIEDNTPKTEYQLMQQEINKKVALAKGSK